MVGDFSWRFLIYQMVHPLTSSYSSVRMNLTNFGAGIIIAKVLLALNVLFSIWGMGINMMRNKRKADRLRVSLIMTAVISLVGFILMMVLL